MRLYNFVNEDKAVIERVFHQIDEAIMSLPSASANILEWEKQYWRTHSNRYKVNLECVNRFAVGKRVLEIGSVPCHFTALLATSGYKVTGVDPEPERSQKLIQQFSLDVIKRDIEIESFPFDDNSFETIVFSEVIEHMYVNPLHALREISRVLAPKGKLLLFTDNLYSLHVLKNFVIGNSINDAVKEWMKLEAIGHRGHIRLYSTKEIIGLLSVAGLTPIRQAYFQYNESFRSRFIYRFIPNQLHPSQLVIATKNIG
jgi:SAM-dependent methyltransferase